MGKVPNGFEADITSRLEKKTLDAKRLANAVLAWSDEVAVVEARAMDESAARGEVLPPLAGMPVSVKANVDVAGWTTNAGSRVLEGEPAADVDAPLVAALRRAGAIVLAQTNMVEFAFGALGQNEHFGNPLTPLYANEARLPGGSSSGAAVSVAVGLVDAAVGTDTSGSVRLPASYCGISGFKPTQGRYSKAGIVPLAPTFDTPGFLARSIEMCDRLDAAVTSRQFQAVSEGSLQGKRFIVPWTFVERNSDASVLAAFSEAVSVLVAAGAEITDLDLDYLPDIGDLARQGLIIPVEGCVSLQSYLESRASLFDPVIRQRILVGNDGRAVDYVRALQGFAELSTRYHADTASFDAVLTPTGPSEPPLVSEIADTQRYLEINLRALKFTEFANRINVPSLAVPIGERDEGIGLLANGRFGEDVELLSVGRLIEDSLSTTLAI